MKQIKIQNKCSNSNCVTNYETYVSPKFILVNKDKNKYICEFCSTEHKMDN
ncbi:aspartate carbamoyltransferase [uncultured Clostridium sp.]|jgi:aspartate carbamoyltransferase regulatory subunit|uniref:aspartate carbamoyltransferase n=1 Tax=uncultured Clostridium sp. TaxID=59620 RepID=UPI002619A9CD|nr:aspartate carbamoyltransferase [uncultured Clostridium sp.]